MDQKALSERVRSLEASTSELVQKHVAELRGEDEGSESRPEPTTTAIAKRAEPVAKLTGSTATALRGDAHENEVATSNTLPTPDELNAIFTSMGALFPPYEPETLVMLFEHSNALRPNVDAYVTNIDAFGARLEPVIDLESTDADERIGDAIFLERLRESERTNGSAVAQADYPTPEEVAKRKVEIKHAMRIEKAQLETFLEGAAALPEASMVELREKTRTDLEVTGNAYWEILRNAAGRVSQFTYAPAHSIRLMPIQQPIQVSGKRRVSAFKYEIVPSRRRFRTFVQVVYHQVVYFKEYGDPRTLSAKTGRYYNSVADMLAAEPEAVPATEILHFKIHSARSPYGVPRWIGNLLSVLGSRSAEEVNYLYFDNKAIPPVAVLVSGGRLAPDATKKIESYIKDHIKGKENFHKILVIEAISANGQTPGMPDNGRTRITIERLTDSQQKDGLFQEYDERNIDKLGAAFRLPRLVRGDARDFNRSTAEASLDFVESQVFQPERNRFDELMNRQIFPELGVSYWRYVSNTPASKDPDKVVEWISKLVERGVITISEGRELARDIFNREFKKIDAAWAEQPMALTLAGLQPPLELGADGSGGGGVESAPEATTAARPATPEERSLAAVAANLSALRDRLRGAAEKAAARIAKEERAAYDRGEIITIALTKAQLEELVVDDDAEAGA